MHRLCTRLVAHSRHLLRHEGGVAAIEFALIGPLAVIFTLVVLELTLVLNHYLRLDEALRQATREAVIAPAIVDLQPLAGGAFVCTQPDQNLYCSGSSVTHAASFERIHATAANILPGITPQMITVSYRASGVGNAATMGGSQPLVTISIRGYRYETLILSMVGIGNITFRDHSLSRIKAL